LTYIILACNDIGLFFLIRYVDIKAQFALLNNVPEKFLKFLTTLKESFTQTDISPLVVLADFQENTEPFLKDNLSVFELFIIFLKKNFYSSLILITYNTENQQYHIIFDEFKSDEICQKIKNLNSVLTGCWMSNNNKEANDNIGSSIDEVLNCFQEMKELLQQFFGSGVDVELNNLLKKMEDMSLLVDINDALGQKNFVVRCINENKIKALTSSIISQINGSIKQFFIEHDFVIPSKRFLELIENVEKIKNEQLQVDKIQ
jgi:hypothetical protein